ncbi:hypothetical protein [Rhizobium sp. CSW-27]|uniref:hypothetical protein n=1 Tax=Rhizobium sp. CSW-27 TaxID=2839985 RepID=UPI002078D732|nr:hypothetical protein [Rhizobium sp. CSW-27]
MDDGRHAGAACDLADIVIAAQARFAECRSGALMLNGQTLRRTGALELNFNGSRDPANWRAAAAHNALLRPWDLHRSYDWRSRRFDDVLPDAVRRLISGSGG